MRSFLITSNIVLSLALNFDSIFVRGFFQKWNKTLLR